MKSGRNMSGRQFTLTYGEGSIDSVPFLSIIAEPVIPSQLPDEKLLEAGFYPATDHRKWIEEREQRGDGKFVVINKGNKLLVRGK